jgi:hypothetical protein
MHTNGHPRGESKCGSHRIVLLLFILKFKQMNRRIKKNYLLLMTVLLAVFLFSGCAEQTSNNLKPLKTLESPEPTNKPPAIQTSIPVYNSVPVVDYNESSNYEPQTFGGNDCIGDCSGHEAGYNWAEEKDIDDPSDCGGNSNSFIEGCETYAEEQQGISNDYESSYDDSDYYE